MATKKEIELTKDEMKLLHKGMPIDKDEVVITYDYLIDPALPSQSELEEKESEDTEEEIDELVDFDGSILGNKVPLGYNNNQTISQKKTTDAVVPATRQSGEQGKGYFYKRYWGESVESEKPIKEIDMQDMLGVQNEKSDGLPLKTDRMDFEEIVDMYEKEYGFNEDEAKDRAEASGAIEGEEDLKRLNERAKLKKISEDRMRKMIEVILSKRSEDGEISSKEIDEDEEDINYFLDRKINQLKKLGDKEGLDIKVSYNKK
jgi:hypothetical protein